MQDVIDACIVRALVANIVALPQTQRAQAARDIVTAMARMRLRGLLAHLVVGALVQSDDKHVFDALLNEVAAIEGEGYLRNVSSELRDAVLRGDVPRGMARQGVAVVVSALCATPAYEASLLCGAVGMLEAFIRSSDYDDLAPIAIRAAAPHAEALAFSVHLDIMWRLEHHRTRHDAPCAEERLWAILIAASEAGLLFPPPGIGYDVMEPYDGDDAKRQHSDPPAPHLWRIVYFAARYGLPAAPGAAAAALRVLQDGFARLGAAAELEAVLATCADYAHAYRCDPNVYAIPQNAPRWCARYGALHGRTWHLSSLCAMDVLALARSAVGTP